MSDMENKTDTSKGKTVMKTGIAQRPSSKSSYNEAQNNQIELQGDDRSDVIAPIYSTIVSKDADSTDIFTKRQIIKSLLVLSIAFVLLFTSFGAMANLQSSLNMESGTGSGSLAVIYAALIISCLFLPPFMIAQSGCKWAIPISITGYILYMVANFYPVWGTMVPAAVLLGLGAAPLWSAKCTYLTTIGVWYARMTKNSDDAIINRFFGIFFLFFQTTQIWGNIIVFTVLSSSGNITRNYSEQRTCGARFCPEQMTSTNNTNLERPVDTKIYILCGLFVALAISGMLTVVFFLDPIKTKYGTGTTSCVSPKLLTETFRHVAASRYQKLLIPLTLYSGVEQAIIGGFLSHGACKLVLLLWVPDSNSLYVFYIIVIFWGIGDAVMQPQINGLYGILFKDNPEAGFANYRLWESIGFLIQYTYNDILCTSTKLYISLAVLIAGACGYSVVEVLHRHELRTRWNENV